MRRRSFLFLIRRINRYFKTAIKFKNAGGAVMNPCRINPYNVPFRYNNMSGSTTNYGKQILESKGVPTLCLVSGLIMDSYLRVGRLTKGQTPFIFKGIDLAVFRHEFDRMASVIARATPFEHVWPCNQGSLSFVTSMIKVEEIGKFSPFLFLWTFVNALFLQRNPNTLLLTRRQAGPRTCRRRSGKPRSRFKMRLQAPTPKARCGTAVRSKTARAPSPFVQKVQSL